MTWRQLIASLLVSTTILASSVRAQEEPAQPEAAAQEQDPNVAVWQAAFDSMVRGPQNIALRDQGALALPDGYGFMSGEHAVKVMELMGNQTDERFIGLIFPLSDEADWFVTVDYEASGYIKDDDAKDWDADGLLENLKDGTEQGNEHREQIGVPPIKVTRWVEAPTYDSALKQLIWSAELRLKEGEDPDPGVNYNTYVLGREGYISLCLVTALSTVEAEKPAARQLLAAVSFNDGKRYEDFDPSTDNVAAYGLAALVGGVAAKKLGLFAALGVFLAKFGKVIAIGAIAAGAGLVKMLKRKNEGEQQA